LPVHLGMTDDETLAHPTPHDALFKRVFGDLERGGALLRSSLPVELSRVIAWDRLERVPTESVGAALRGLSSDLVFSAEIGGRRSYICVLVEHQSTPDPQMPRRVVDYVARIWERHAAPVDGRLVLPLVVPLVVYHGARPWRVPLDIGDALDIDEAVRDAVGVLVPRVRYHLDDLTRLDATALRARGLPAWGTVALWALRSAFDRGFVTTATELASLFQQVAAAEDGGEALATLVGYLGFISRPGEDLVGALISQLDGLALEKMMELEEMLARKKREEGRQEGRAEGLAEGRAQRGTELLMKLLRLKFGELDPETVQRLSDASEAELDRWAERVLTASDLSEVFA